MSNKFLLTLEARDQYDDEYHDAHLVAIKDDLQNNGHTDIALDESGWRINFSSRQDLTEIKSGMKPTFSNLHEKMYASFIEL